MLLFVYGTMLTRGRNHTRLWEQGAIRIGDEEFLTTDPFDLFVRPDLAPVAIRNWDSGLPVSGELFAITEDAIEHIDLMEGHPTVYRREPVGVQGFDDRNTLVVYMYVYPGAPPEGSRRIIPVDGYLEYDPVLK